MAGTGAFLLVLAAAVFVAVRWDQIPDAAKLGSVALLTGSALVAGRTLRPRLPATAGVLFHLGAFLLPIDVAAIAVDRGAGWPGVLLAEGIAGLVAFSVLARLDPTVPLRWAVGGSGLVLAAGLAAVSSDSGVLVPLSPGMVLAGLAVAAVATDRGRLGAFWAIAAGAGPLLGLREILVPDPGVWAQLNVDPPIQVWAPMVVGLVAAAVLAVEAQRRSDLGLAAAAVSVALLGGGTSWSGAEVSGSTSLLLAAGLFGLVEGAALLLRHDELWGEPTDLLARVAEVVAVPGAFAAAGVVAVLPLHDVSGTPVPAGACLLLGIAWFLADLRRRDRESSIGRALLAGGGQAWAIGAGTASLVASVAIAGGPIATALVMAVLATAVVVTGRTGASLAAVVLATWAPLAAILHEPAFAAVVGVTGALTSAYGARLHSASAAHVPGDADVAWRYAIGAVAPAAVAGWAIARVLDPAVGVTAAAVLLWTVGVIAGSTPSRWTDGLGHPARIAALGTLAWFGTLGSVDTALLAAGLGAVAVLDTVRTDDLRIAYALAVTVPPLVAASAEALGFAVGSTGIALVLAATVAVGIASLTPVRWCRPLIATTATTLTSGLILASSDDATLGVALVVTGGVLLGAAVIRSSSEVAIVGGLVLVLGTWLVLGTHEVGATDAYAAPVAGALVIVGWLARRADGSRPSSWVAYGPAIGLLGSTALLARVDGGSGWHALAAGGLGVVAVAVGGARRLGAPLLLGTALVVASAGYESLAYTRSVPTWTWLALGGAALLAAGIAMERHEVGPLETGRRLADVIQDRYR